MELHAPPEPVAIETDADGVIRVGGTRVTLDTLIAAFDAGATAEEIAQQYRFRHVGGRLLGDWVLPPPPVRGARILGGTSEERRPIP